MQITCEQCGRPVAAGRPRCLFCGHVVAPAAMPLPPGRQAEELALESAGGRYVRQVVLALKQRGNLAGWRAPKALWWSADLPTPSGWAVEDAAGEPHLQVVLDVVSGDRVAYICRHVESGARLTAAEAPGWLLQAMGALLEHGRCNEVVLLSNRPAEGSVADALAQINKRLDRLGVPAGRRARAMVVDTGTCSDDPATLAAQTTLGGDDGGAPKVATAASAARVAAPPERPEGCPRCRGEAGPRPTLLQTWTSAPTFWSELRGARRYKVRSVEAPGLCSTCQRWRRRRQLLATLVVAVPLGFLVALNPVVAFVLAMIYVVYVARVSSNAIVDDYFWALELKEALLPWRPPGTEARLPLGGGQWVVRLALTGGFAMAGLVISDLVRAFLG